MPHRFKAWLPAVAVATTIYVLSAQSFAYAIPGWVSQLISIAAHTTEYGLLAVALWWGFRQEGMDASSARSLALLVVFVFGVGDEIHQAFVPGRNSSPWDVVNDMAGAALGLWLRAAIARGWRTRRARARVASAEDG